MIQRCCNPKSSKFPYYGAKGISVCLRWKTFRNFLDDMGERPEGKTIDRFPDKNGNYTPENCRWGDVAQQANNRNSNRVIEFNGTKKTMAEWSKSLGMNYGKLQSRLDRNWPLHLAMNPSTRRRDVNRWFGRVVDKDLSDVFANCKECESCFKVVGKKKTFCSLRCRQNNTKRAAYHLNRESINEARRLKRASQSGV